MTLHYAFVTYNLFHDVLIFDIATAARNVKKFQMGDSQIGALRYLEDMFLLCVGMYDGKILAIWFGVFFMVGHVCFGW